MFTEKCSLSLVMTSVRPVNRLLGFGIRGMIPSDVVQLVLLLWICISQIFTQSACWAGSCFTHSHGVSCIERAAAHGSAMSVRKNLCCAHSEWSKMSVRGRERKGSARKPGDPQSCHEERVCWSMFIIYTQARA